MLIKKIKTRPKMINPKEFFKNLYRKGFVNFFSFKGKSPRRTVCLSKKIQRERIYASIPKLSLFSVFHYEHRFKPYIIINGKIKPNVLLEHYNPLKLYNFVMIFNMSGNISRQIMQLKCVLISMDELYFYWGTRPQRFTVIVYVVKNYALMHTIDFYRKINSCLVRNRVSIFHKTVEKIITTIPVTQNSDISSLFAQCKNYLLYNTNKACLLGMNLICKRGEKQEPWVLDLWRFTRYHYNFLEHPDAAINYARRRFNIIYEAIQRNDSSYSNVENKSIQIVHFIKHVRTTTTNKVYISTKQKKQEDYYVNNDHEEQKEYYT